MVHLGPFPIRWYALGYIVSLIIGWLIAARLVRKDPLWGDGRGLRRTASTTSWSIVAFGAVLGGRTGYVLFYNLPFFLAASARNSAGVEGRHVVPRRPGRGGAGRLAVRPARKIAVLQRRRPVLRGGADRPVPGAPRQFHQAGTLGPADATFPGR